MRHNIAKFLLSVDEPEYAQEVEVMHNRLEAFSDGLDKDVRNCLIKTAEEVIKQRDELLAAAKLVLGDASLDEGFTALTKAVRNCEGGS